MEKRKDGSCTVSYTHLVGKVQMLTMYPMDLEEVLWAKGKQMLADTIREHYENNQPLDEILHEEAMQEFYHYCIVGGMPAAVKADLAKDSPIEPVSYAHLRVSHERVHHPHQCPSAGLGQRMPGGHHARHH